MKLKELHINNFKFFPKQDPNSPLLKIDGKNLLIYGENGSGKSTIYWALYTLLESSFKLTNDEVEKYFNKGGLSSLVNINSPRDHKAFIKATLSSSAGVKDYLVSGNVAEIQAIRSNSAARESGMASDFINYRALFKLHYAKHTSDNNLFSWFEDEILPYIRTGNTKTFVEELKQLRRGPKKVQNLAGETIFANATMRIDGNPAVRKDYKQFSTWVSSVNSWKKELSTFLNKITTRANDILREDFMQALEIKLELVPPKYNISSDAIDPNKPLQNLNWSEPEIRIQIAKYQGKRNVVKRPHSFLNEAKWTAIGLSIRLAILDDTTYRPSPVDLKCLVMDDMLLSLDMSNRDVVLNMLINRYINDYQLILMTHDRSFYEFSKRKIEIIGQKKDWQFLEMFENDLSKYPQPYFKPEKVNIQIAEDYYNQHDYPACGIYLRKEVEKLLKNLLPEDFKKEASKADPFVQVDKKLNDLILSLKSYCEADNVDYVGLEHLKTYKDALLNPLAHNDIDAPYFRSELKKLIEVVKMLEKIKRNRRLHQPGKNLNFILHKGDGTFFSVFMKSKEPVILIEEEGKPARISLFAKCKVSSTNNNGTIVTVEENFNTLRDAYEEMCSRYTMPPIQDLSRVFDYDGQTFDQKFAAL